MNSKAAKGRSMHALPQVKVWLVDPSLYTAPYDAALTAGLLAAGVTPTWATRRLRAGDRQEIPPQSVDAFFYRGVDGLHLSRLRSAFKGLSHLLGLCRLVVRVWRQRPAAVHFQWAVLPQADALAILIIKQFCPVVLTVHDTVPFNGEHVSCFQNWGFALPIRLADQVIVHTEASRRTLVARGLAAQQVTVIPHGPLRLLHPVLPVAERLGVAADAKWTVVLFGEIKPYKGLDVLVEALGKLPEHVRTQAHVIVAGRPRMDLAAIQRRISELGLTAAMEIRPQRQSEVEMAALFERADCFVFPYRQIDASGVYFLVKSLGRWLIASDVGVFAEEMRDGRMGALVTPGDVDALASQLQYAIEARPCPAPSRTDDSWDGIGRATRALYERARAARQRPALSSRGSKRAAP